MLEAKILEIRDRGTFCPCIAILFRPETVDDPVTYLMARVGSKCRTVFFGRLYDMRLEYDPTVHGPGRTLNVAHTYCMTNWDDVRNGDVLDVEFLLGESNKRKESERCESV